MCFVDLKKTFDRVPRKVSQWAMRKKGILDVMISSMMSLYGSKDKSQSRFCVVMGV